MATNLTAWSRDKVSIPDQLSQLWTGRRSVDTVRKISSQPGLCVLCTQSQERSPSWHSHWPVHSPHLGRAQSPAIPQNALGSLSKYSAPSSRTWKSQEPYSQEAWKQWCLSCCVCCSCWVLQSPARPKMVSGEARAVYKEEWRGGNECKRWAGKRAPIAAGKRECTLGMGVWSCHLSQLSHF